jgi:polar amino acid transport system substrate-binding protein
LVLKGAVDLRTKITWLFFLIITFSFPFAGHAAPDVPPDRNPGGGKTLIVGIDPIPPFALRTEEGQWHGISWAIWHMAALRLGWRYEIKLMPLDQIIPALRAGEIDVAATAFGITGKREAKVDFSVPYYFSSFGVATAKPRGIHAWMALSKDVFSSYLLKPVLFLTAILLLVSLLFWLCERRKERENKDSGFFRGIGNAFLLSSETMTTVGYGANVPKTKMGRTLACIWMFVSIILVSSLTASVTSSLTTIQLRKTLYDLEDLHHIRVGCLAPPSRSALYLERLGIVHQSFNTVQAALKALSQRKLDAVVYDFSTLQYLVHKDYRDELTVLSRTFNPKFLALPLPPNSPLRRPLNKAILEIMETPLWHRILVSYIGKDAVPSMLPFVRGTNGQ